MKQSLRQYYSWFPVKKQKKNKPKEVGVSEQTSWDKLLEKHEDGSYKIKTWKQVYGLNFSTHKDVNEDGEDYYFVHSDDKRSMLSAHGETPQEARLNFMELLDYLREIEEV